MNKASTLKTNIVGAQSGNGNMQIRANQISGMLQSAGNKASLTGRDLVMLEFMRSSLAMSQTFLDSQERVMIAYLNGSINLRAQSSLSRDTLIAEKSIAAAEAVEQPMISAYQTAMPEQAEPELDFRPAQSNSSAVVTSYELLTPVASLERTTSQEPNSRNQFAASSAAVPAAKTESPAAVPTQMQPEQLILQLINIVSERTGYPPEMLDPSLDLEADLGIDSIKRVEILNSFRRLLPENKQLMLENGIEKLAGVKTLQGIMDWIRNDLVSLGEDNTQQAPPLNNIQEAVPSRMA